MRRELTANNVRPVRAAALAGDSVRTSLSSHGAHGLPAGKCPSLVGVAHLASFLVYPAQPVNGEHDERDALKFNRTVFNAVLAPLIVAAVLGLAGWG